MADSRTPPIIVKKKISHGGHHGGAWKVAYADFVTAMMSLFIVLWLMNTSKPIQDAVSGYFKDPSGVSTKPGSDAAGPPKVITVKKEDMEQLKADLEKAISEVSNFSKFKSHIVMTITSEGLRIELLESAGGTFFDSGSAKITGDSVGVISALAEELGKLPNKLAIEGHTDSKPYGPGALYTNWELSSDRANAARRLMQANGVRPDQVTQVRGFANQRLRKPDYPLDPSNRRISVIVKYVDAKPEVETPYNPGSISDEVGTTQGSAAPRTVRPPAAAAKLGEGAPKKD
jgi:chemotaxis protein MotB